MRGHLHVTFTPSFEGQNPPETARPSRLLLYKHPAPVSPLECALPQHPATVHSKQLTRSSKSFRMRTYEKTGGRVPHSFPPPHSPFTPKGTDCGSPGLHFLHSAFWLYAFCPLLSRLFSCNSTLPNLQFLCFDNDTNCPGVGMPLDLGYLQVLLELPTLAPGIERSSVRDSPASFKLSTVSCRQWAYFGWGSAGAGARTSRKRAMTSEMRKGFCKKEGSPRAGDSGPDSMRSPVM